MNDYKRLLLLIGIMVGLATIVGGLIIGTLYNASIAEERQRLAVTAQSQARLMEAVAHFDSLYSKEFPSGPFEATISQIRDAFARSKGFGETGDIILARKSGANIRFILNQRHSDVELLKPIPYDSIFAEPMRRALSGQSGTQIGLDYRGKMVIAAYEPIKAMNLGIVAKVDLDEIRAPFFKAARLASVFGLMATLFALFLFLRVSNPMVQHIRQSESRYRFEAIFNGVPDTIAFEDTDHKIIMANPALKKTFGYSDTDVLGMTLNDLFARPRLTKEQQFLNHITSDTPASQSLHAEFKRDDGSLFPGEIIRTLINDTSGNALGYLNIIRDITERRQGEDALLNAKMESEKANLAKTKFLAAASHDLRQPLQALGLFIMTLVNVAREPHIKEIAKSLQEMFEATSGLLEALLDISKLDASVVKPDYRDFAVCDLLDQIKVESAANAESKGLDLRLIESSTVIRSDPFLLSRVLRNLTSNAIRFTTSGRILIGCRRRNNKLRIEIWDTGIGIPRDQKSHIFEEFVQIQNPQRDRNQGLGLGLAIVSRISSLLSLNVHVSSTPGKGSMFSIEVPIGDAQDIANAVPSDSVPHDVMEILDKNNILVIDDDPVQLKAMESLLLTWNCTALTATSAKEAMEKLTGEGNWPSLILADLRLRDGKTGVEAIEQIQSYLGRDIPGIIITGDTAPDRLHSATGSGYKLLHKPIRPNALLSTISEALS